MVIPDIFVNHEKALRESLKIFKETCCLLEMNRIVAHIGMYRDYRHVNPPSTKIV